MLLVDTNVLLNAVNSDSPEHARARRNLESCVNGREVWCLTWGLIYEYLRVATHPRVFRNPLSFDQALKFLGDLTSSGNCRIISETGEHMGILASCAEETHRLSGNVLHDFHTAVLMREHGIEDIVTGDRDFRAFPWLRIRDMGA